MESQQGQQEQGEQQQQQESIAEEEAAANKQINWVDLTVYKRRTNCKQELNERVSVLYRSLVECCKAQKQTAAVDIAKLVLSNLDMLLAKMTHMSFFDKVSPHNPQEQQQKQQQEQLSNF